MAIDLIVTRWIQQNDRGLSSTLGRLEGDFRRYESASDRAMQRSQQWGYAMVGAGAIGTRAIAGLVKESLNAAGQVSRIKVGFESLLGSQEGANKLLADVRQLDLETPFSFLETAQVAQSGLASGFREDLIPTMRSIANATVAAGKGTETYTRAMAIASKIKAQGYLSAVRLNQFGSAGIPAREILRKELGLSADDMMNIGKLKLSADVVLPALTRGFDKAYPDAIKKAAEQYLGAAEILEGAQDKLKASIGKSIEKDATKIIQSLTGMTNAVEGFVATHPRLTAAGIILGGIGSVALTVAGAYKVLRYYQLQSAAANALMTMAQRKETAAEVAKIPVAYGEARAHQAAALAAGEHALANRALGGSMLALPGPAGVAPGIGATAAGGRLAGLRALLSAPLFSQGAPMAMTRAGVPRAIGMQALGNTIGSGLASVGVGAAAGYGVYDDYRSLGNGKLEAATKGMATGVTAAVASIFLPGAAVPVALATGIRYLYNQSGRYVEQQRAEEDANYKSLSKAQKGMSGRGLAKDNLQRALELEKAANEIDTTLDFAGDDRWRKESMLAEADRLRMLGSIQSRQENKKNTPDAQYARWVRGQYDIYDAQRAQERDAARRAGDDGTQAVSARRQAQMDDGQSRVIEERNGVRTVTIRLPESRGDRQARQARYNSVTATPNLAI